MFRKLLLIAMLALSFLATPGTTLADGDPLPECAPCPWQK
jgi:hypothetical protein